MPATYEKNKKHIYKWRENNRASHLKSNSKYNQWRAIQKIYLAILL
jgi:hypothetical protein